jgi:hypothetical protein
MEGVIQCSPCSVGGGGGGGGGSLLLKDFCYGTCLQTKIYAEWEIILECVKFNANRRSSFYCVFTYVGKFVFFTLRHSHVNEDQNRIMYICLGGGGARILLNI